MQQHVQLLDAQHRTSLQVQVLFRHDRGVEPVTEMLNDCFRLPRNYLRCRSPNRIGDCDIHHIPEKSTVLPERGAAAPVAAAPPAKIPSSPHEFVSLVGAFTPR
ncbi:hypothetical protein [Chiayiivirga flava]|uniref:Uncharacterized protein n=1 Tax=Chiayiivirga flava TaxID=659595 RepID=A0A7W8G1K6_9GAMM|nr:hypothetical protein [Chiayiivirga flava]MBB5207740.1 hypothetical protein [Chiayiivirga flava]